MQQNANLDKIDDIMKNENLNENDIRKIINEYDELPENLADLIYIIFEKKLPVIDLTKKVDADDFDKYYNAFTNKNDFLRVFMAYFEEDNDKLTEIEAAWLAKIAYFFIVSDVPMNDMMIVSVFIMYSSLMMDYMVAIYNDTYINDESASTFPKEIQIGYFSYEAAVAFDDGDAKKSVHYLKQAAIIDKRLKNVVIAMGNLFKLNSANDSKSSEKEEFEALAKQIKDNICRFISQGKKDEAIKLIESYKELNPSDPEIESLIFMTKC